MSVNHYRALRRGSLTAKPYVCNTTEAAATDNGSRAKMLHDNVNFKPNKEKTHVPN